MTFMMIMSRVHCIWEPLKTIAVRDGLAVTKLAEAIGAVAAIGHIPCFERIVCDDVYRFF